MNKILKPYTIVPSNLYVERSADRQVKNILEDMGRPGYVLVSRQMGKTNLLINARRKYSSDNDRFIYVDLSNLFDNEIQCFRNIIDTAIETNLDVFSQLEIEIRDYRKSNSELPPHKQHEKELRMLLNTIKGKLIIILDEIDALTKVEYSDRIFAQIRSVYFARTNYNEFDRLTYLLSGVVEPSELIKDPKISPFNIGEKIFLNDFTRAEFDSFLYQAELSHLDGKIKNRIFYWTNGNPRLTWDICCIIEDLKEINLEESDIDSFVKTHYLTSFDKPPVDNIREIVKKDLSIQDALIEIEYGKGDVISDDIKQKLYLSGIINYIENDVKIKNRIIKESLSSQWINSIRTGTINLLEKGILFYNDKSFKSAISTLKTYLSKQNNDPENNEDFNVCRFYLGLSYYYDNNFEDALLSLLDVGFDPKQFGNFFYKTELFKGYIFQNTKKLKEAKEAFEKIVNIGIYDEYYLSAKINLASLLSEGKNNLDTQKSKDLFGEIANSKIEDYKKIEEVLFIESKTVALFYLGELEKKNSINIYDSYLKEALLISPIKFKPSIVYNLFLKERDLSKQTDYLKIITNLIIENNLKTNKSLEFDSLKFNYKILREIQLQLFKFGEIDAFEDLINYEKAKMSRYDDLVLILDKLIGVAQEQDYPFDFIYRLTEYLLSNCQTDQFAMRNKAIKLLASIDVDTDLKYSLKYMKTIGQISNENIDLTDVLIYIKLVQYFLNLKDVKNVAGIINDGEILKSKLSDEIKTSSLIFDFFEMIYLNQLGNQLEKSRKIASYIMNHLKTFENQYLKNPLIRQMGVQNIINHCLNILGNVNKTVSDHSSKKLGRNDQVKVRYVNGKEVITKYKRIELDLKNGKCLLIN